MLQVFEIFPSISGEMSGIHQGRTCTFIRLAGCNLKCKWGDGFECDAAETQPADSGEAMDLADIMAKVGEFGFPAVVITGGEPLLQWEELSILVSTLVANAYEVCIETNGTIPLPRHPLPRWEGVQFIVDFKLPSTGYVNRMVAMQDMKAGDILKFVIADSSDLDFAVHMHKNMLKENTPPIWFAYSPVHGMFLGELIAKRLLAEKLDAVVSLQLHKIMSMP